MLQLWDFSFPLFRVVLEAKDIVKVVSIFFDGLYNRGVPVVVNQMKIFLFLVTWLFLVCNRVDWEKISKTTDWHFTQNRLH